MKLHSIFSAFRAKGESRFLSVIVPITAAFMVAFAPVTEAAYGTLPFMSLLDYLKDQFTGVVAVTLGVLGFCYVGFCALTGNFSRALMTGFGLIIVVSCIFFAPTLINWIQESAGVNG